MGNVKNILSDWLEDCGYELGYDFDFYPLESQFKTIKTKRQPNHHGPAECAKRLNLT